jgi:DNA repair ATPase RecN
MLNILKNLSDRFTREAAAQQKTAKQLWESTVRALADATEAESAGKKLPPVPAEDTIAEMLRQQRRTPADLAAAVDRLLKRRTLARLLSEEPEHLQKIKQLQAEIEDRNAKHLAAVEAWQRYRQTADAELQSLQAYSARFDPCRAELEATAPEELLERQRALDDERQELGQAAWRIQEGRQPGQLEQARRQVAEKEREIQALRPLMWAP